MEISFVARASAGEQTAMMFAALELSKSRWLIATHSPVADYQGLKAWLPATLGWTLTVTKHWWIGKSGFWGALGQQPPEIPSGFHIMPRRWVVERSFA